MLRRPLPLFLAAASCLSAQTQSPSTAPPPTIPASDAQNKISVNSDLVVLPVTVKNQSGDLVPDLERSEFRIFDNDVEQSIDIFTQEAFPLSRLVILIDDDLKSKDAAQMAPTLRAITAGISADDEAIVARFDLDFYPTDGFTSDLDKIWSDLQNVKLHSDAHENRPTPAIRQWPARCLQLSCRESARQPRLASHQSARRRHPLRRRPPPRPRPRPPKNDPHRV